MTGAAAALSRTALRPGPGARWAGAFAIAAAIALVVAKDAGVAGPAALADVVRILAGSIVFLGICGYAPARVLLPPSLAGDWPLFVLPLGAACGAMALTFLGFVAVPFPVALVVVLAAGVAAAVHVHRTRELQPAAREVPFAWIAALALLIVALALIPTFRTGLVTVTGFGSDAHVAAGSATVVQHTHPAGLDASLPVDTIPWQWRSKAPIFYGLAGASTLSGLEPWQVLMTFSALLLAVTAIGFFLLARHLFGATLAVAAAAMAVAVLDRRVFHLALHPYYNQLWGLLTLPFALVAARAWLDDRGRRTFALFALFLAVGMFAYPLALPFPVAAVLCFWLHDRWRARRAGEPVEPLHFPRWRWWMLPVVLVLAGLIVGVIEKFVSFVILLGKPEALRDWQGDLFFYPPLGQFFGVARELPLEPLLVAAVCAVAAWGLWASPNRRAAALAPMLVAAGLAAVVFRYVEAGQYIYFKILAFAGPVVLVAAAAGLGRMKALGAVGLLALVLSGVLLARDEIGTSFDQLTPQTIEIRDWARELPRGASIRLDTPPSEQIWQMYMLADRPTGSRNPLIFYPHVEFTRGADYAIDKTLVAPPADAVGDPVRRNSALRMWRLGPDAGPDTTSQRQSNAGAPPGSLAR